ncbi:DUF2231 domain-containing protein [Nonomuraea sp. NPDC050663]|uniref:Putative membrane protein n=1 Tax=Nonomuraea soli TaxID=1032476 RepID=A0A7W0HTL4_9ACTN|nr:DUF2231 domain-containing protein [Nonomuraea soli]MBA2895165.1 putative membrane protein [Nonomuraea soli]NUT39076.1 hypothetical protein [Thermoactinospora sp.]
MFDEILGLPAHPLIIHAAVVFTPLLALMGVVYAVLPRFQPATGWAVVALAVLAPGAVFAARQSGLALKQARFESVQGDLATKIAAHESFANPLLYSTIGLAVSALAMVFVPKGVPKTILSVTTVVLAAVAGYYVFRAGDSGAQAVWGL